MLTDDTFVSQLYALVGRISDDDYIDAMMDILVQSHKSYVEHGHDMHDTHVLSLVAKQDGEAFIVNMIYLFNRQKAKDC